MRGSTDSPTASTTSSSSTGTEVRGMVNRVVAAATAERLHGEVPVGAAEAARGSIIIADAVVEEVGVFLTRLGGGIDVEVLLHIITLSYDGNMSTGTLKKQEHLVFFTNQMGN